ncbi:MAG: restriction endonuclease subunit S [Bacteroidetes bacterium]|nr:restriction endonuclease subunit S [Bacteroidota bacterium]
MKQGWQIKKLGDVCEKGSSNVSQNQLTNEEGEYPIFGASGFIKNVSFYHNEKPYLSIVKDGSGVGRVTKMEAKTSVIGTLQYLFPKDGIDLNYLYYYLQTIDFKKYVAGAAIPHIYFKDYQNEYFPYVPLEVQHRIVSILDKAFSATEQAKNNAQQNLKNTKELFESYLQGVFENGKWEKKKLQDVAKVFGRGKSKHRPRNWEGLYGGKYPFIQTGEVRNANKYISNYTQTYNEAGLAQSKLWKKGTICITIAANIAETAILDFDACIPDSIIGFEVDEKKADLNFAYYLLQYFKAELQKLGKGSAQDNINLGTFETQYFPFPSLEEQQTIVRQLDALRAETQKLEAVYQKKIDDLEELKKSVLRKAFAGELRSPEGAGYISIAPRI